jgi:hypothetical protein
MTLQRDTHMLAELNLNPIPLLKENENNKHITAILVFHFVKS